MTFLKYQQNEKQLENFSSIEWLTTQAVANHKEGKLEDAIAFYLEVIELDENQPAWLYSNAITLLIQLNHLKEGFELGEKAEKIYPESDEIYQANRSLVHHQNNISKVQNSYSKSAKIQINKHIAYKNLDRKSFVKVLEPRETPQDIENQVNLDIASIRRQLMDSAIVEQFQIILEQILFDYQKGEKEMDYDALVNCLAEIKTDIHYLKTKLLDPSPATVDPQAKPAINLQQILNSPQAIPLKCELKNRIVGSGWHTAEQHGRWTGPGTITSLVFPYPMSGKYKFEMVVRAESKAGLLSTLRINISDRPLEISLLQSSQHISFPIVIQGEFVTAQEQNQSFLAVDLMIAETVNPQGNDSRLIGLLIEKISLIPLTT